MDRSSIARWLRASRIGAEPCDWLGAISIFVDEHYDNFDYDVIGPRVRLAIAKVLAQNGFRQRSGRVFEGRSGWIEFPAPNRTLASDPATEVERLLERPHTTILATPTQVLLTTWRRSGPELPEDLQHQLIDLLRAQPANLDKVTDWLRRTPNRSAYVRALPMLRRAQEEGYQERRRGRRPLA